MSSLAHVMQVYEGSDGEATKALYTRLEQLGPVGIVATNLFRAQKNSARAKVYRGGIRGQGSYKSMAYDRKQWALDNLATVLAEHAEVCGLRWGWGEDATQEFHRWVLYVELPNGQVSFHTGKRGNGPDVAFKWDGVRGASPQRICGYVAAVLNHEPALRAVRNGSSPCPQT